MPVIQASPEVRQLDVNVFRLDLKDLEASADGMPWPDTHSHKGETVLSGITYARFFEVIPYYFVTFEDGQYTVNLIGANNNIADVATENQVRLVVNNSAGLINLAQADRIDNTEQWIWIDTGAGNNGTGTQQDPYDNVADGLNAAQTQGIKLLKFCADATLDRALVGYVIEGVGVPVITMNGQNLDRTLFRNVELTGAMAGEIQGQGVILDGASGLAGIIDGAYLRNTNTTAVTGELVLNHSRSGITATLSMNASSIGATLVVQGHSGNLVVSDINNVSDVAEIGMAQGRLELAASCTLGAATLAGLAQFTDNSAGTTVASDRLLDPFTTNRKLDNNFAITASLWGKP